MADPSRETTSPGRVHATPSRRRDLLELLIGYGLILLVIWSWRPWQRGLYYTAAVFLVAVLWVSFESWAAMGLRTANFWRSLWVVGVALVLSAVAVLVARERHILHPVGGPLPFLKRYWGYMIWSLLQQILLVDFFLRRLLRLISKPRYAVLATAAIFSAAHLPNPVLTVVTLVFGTAACLIFLRYRNLYPLAMAHAILGITIALTVPGPLIRNMRVGLGYLTYHSHHGTHASHHRSQRDQTVSTQL